LGLPHRHPIKYDAGVPRAALQFVDLALALRLASGAALQRSLRRGATAPYVPEQYARFRRDLSALAAEQVPRSRTTTL
jgi:hypothetical protein